MVVIVVVNVDGDGNMVVRASISLTERTASTEQARPHSRRPRATLDDLRRRSRRRRRQSPR
jgi:hypothetical protein